MRLITDEQHAQIVEALTNDGTHEDDCPYSNDCFNTDCDHCAPIRETKEKIALATLQALPEVEVVGKVNDTTSTDFQVEFNKLIGIDTPLYATKEPS